MKINFKKSDMLNHKLRCWYFIYAFNARFFYYLSIYDDLAYDVLK